MQCFLIVLVVISCFGPTLARYVPVLVNDPYKPQRDFISDWIQSSSWFPIEVNVPDTFSSIGQGISSGLTNIGNGFGSLIQGIPWFNRFPTQSRPRPMKYFVLMPVGNTNNHQQMDFNPFENAINSFIPTYP